MIELLLAAVFGALLALAVERVRKQRRSHRARIGNQRDTPLLDDPYPTGSDDDSAAWSVSRGMLITRLAEVDQKNCELLSCCQAYERQAAALAAQLEAAKAEAEAALQATAGPDHTRSHTLSLTGLGEDDTPRHSVVSDRAAASSGSLNSSSATQIETDRLIETASMGGGNDGTLSVQVDNRRDDKATLVRVIVSNRVGLLAEMSSVLAGLGLSVITAAVATDEETGRATNDFYVQEQGRKVFGRSRLATIEQRIQQWGRSGWLREGMQRLIDRATLSDREAAVQPPAPLVRVPDAGPAPGPLSARASGANVLTAMLAAPPLPEEDPLHEALTTALKHALAGGALPFGALPATLAADLARAALSQMTVCEMPPRAVLRSNHGEWMILVESGDATVLTEGPAPPDDATHVAVPDSASAAPLRSGSRLPGGAIAAAQQAQQPVQRRPTRALTFRADVLGNPTAANAPDLGMGAAVEEGDSPATPTTRETGGAAERVSLPPCAVLWEVVVLPGDAQSSRHGSPPGSGHSWCSTASAPRTDPVRWLELTSAKGARVRVLHRSELRTLLVSTRERTARQHFKLLHALPVLAPLSPSALLTLCRRAIEIELPPSATVLPVSRRDADLVAKAAAAVLDDTTFCIVLAGELLVSLDPDEAESAAQLRRSASTTPGQKNKPHSGVQWVASSHAPFTNVSTPGAPRRAVPEAPSQQEGAPLGRLPIFRLGVRDTLGEAGALYGAKPPAGVAISTCSQGARVLCWPRDSSLAEALSRLPDLLPGSWRSRAHLGFLVEAPGLARKLFDAGAIRQVSAADLVAMGASSPSPSRRPSRFGSPGAAPSASVCLVTRGTMLEYLPVQVKLTQIAGVVPPSSNFPTGASPVGAATYAPNSPLPLRLDPGQHAAAGAAAEASSASGLSSWRRAARRFELTVKVHSRHRLLADLTSIIHDLGLEVHSARIATETAERGDELANDSFAVTPRGVAAALDTESLVKRICTQLADVLQLHPLLAGDSAISGPDGHRLRVPPTPDEPPGALLVDLAAAAEALAGELRVPPSLPNGVAKRGVGALFRELLTARHPLLARALDAERGPPPSAHSSSRDMLAQQLASPAKPPSSQDWLLALSELCLYLQRESAGQGEEGMLMEDLISEMTLGEGASGTVRLARHRFSGRIYAVKIFDKARLAKGAGGRALLRYIEREREVLQLLSTKLRGDKASAHMVRYVCSGQDGPTLRLVMPACLGGELWNVLAEFGAMSEAEGRFYAGCLVLALQKLHAIGVVYRDLKPENVLLSHTGWPVIADFGLATIGAVDERPLYSMCGTPEFMAPEVVRSLGYGASADWWSLGVLLCQCFTLATPFADPQGRAQMTFSNIVRGRVTAERSQHYRVACSPHAVALLDSLLQPEPAKRLGDARHDAGRIRIHPFFWGLDWQALEARKLTPPHADFCALTAESLLAAPPQPQPSPDRAPDAPELTHEQQQLFAHW